MLQSLPIDVITLIFDFMPYDDLKGIGCIHPFFRSALKRKDFWQKKACCDFFVDQERFVGLREYNDRYRYLACQNEHRIQECDRLIWALVTRQHEQEELQQQKEILQEERCILYTRGYRRQRFGPLFANGNSYPEYMSFDSDTVEVNRILHARSFPMNRAEFECHIDDPVSPFKIVNIKPWNYFVSQDDKVYALTDVLPEQFMMVLNMFKLKTQMDIRDLYLIPDHMGIWQGIEIDGQILRLAHDKEEYHQRKDGYYH